MMRLIAAAILLGVSLWARAAHAGAPACTLSTNGLAFGTYDPTSKVPVTANGTISFICTYTGTGFIADLSISTGNSGTYANRTLSGGGQSLSYNIYVNAADTEIFGGGTGTGSSGTYYYYLCYPGGTVTCTGGGGQSGATYVAPMYGLLPAGQDVSAGNYSDSIIVTLTF